MATEQQDFDKRSDEGRGSTPKPDPTALTSEALREAITTLRTLVDQRIVATEQLFETKIALGREGGMALKELVEAQLKDIQNNAGRAEREARDYVRERFETFSDLLEEKFEGRDKALVAALQAAKEAVEKANTATEKRFDGVNELLGQQTAAVAALLPRTEAEARISDLDRRVGELKSTVDKGFTGTDTRASVGKDNMGYLVGGIGLLLAIVMPIIVFALTR